MSKKLNLELLPITKKANAKSKIVVRILRPNEYKKIESQIIKVHHKVMLQALLFTGMRYIELKRFQKNPRWYDGSFIKISVGTGVKKQQIRMNERYVILNPLGRMAINNFLMLKEELPTNQTWRENLIRWAESAGLDPIGLCPKTTRKTWESWLVFYYPQQIIPVILSQGHTLEVSLKHYLNFPFTKIDRIEMEDYVSGWGNVEYPSD